MSMKVKRGLGLLVVAVIALLAELALAQVQPVADMASLLVGLASIAAGFALLIAAIGGLVLLAWGLLRD